MTEKRERFQQVVEIFQAALDQEPPLRAAFLDHQCGGDEDLRRRVEALLAADEQTSSLLEEDVAGLAATQLLELGEEPSAVGQCVGVHRLRRVIGRGGVGTIYLADRVDGQYDEQVAIKLIRRGMDSDAILRRFRRERQILAGLHHPNIARLLDGGMTDNGTPYFVMEYIDGMTIDQYCDAHQLRVSERLELLRTVCAAVQEAHRRLVVHCDLKPSNILVTEAGEPKLLDFGIARLLDPDGETDLAILTSGERQMTPVYASPEQIRGQGLTTATDIYSLGVVLYELLTGHRPYRLESLARFDVQRVVCEEEPEKPSTAVSRPMTLVPGEGGASRAEVCRARGVTPEGLRRRLAGDLDNIVFRAIRKQPEERYGSVEQLSEDLLRHLTGQPVRARPATAAYRAAKFLHRHRLGVAATILLLLSLLGGIGATLHQAGQARQRGLTAERTLGFLIDVLVGSDPDDPGYGQRTLRDVLDEASEKIRRELDDEPLARSRLMHTIGEVHGKLTYYDGAEPLLESALATRREILGEDHVDVALTMHVLGSLRLDQARFEEAEQLLREALEKRLRLFGEEHIDVASSLNNLALVLKKLDQLDEAETLHRRALDLRRRLRGERHQDVATSLNNLATLLQAQGSFDEAEERFREALVMRRELFGPIHYRVATSLNNLAYLLRLRGKLEEAEGYYREALAVQRRLFGRHRDVAATLNNLGVLRNWLGDPGGAEALFREALPIYTELLGADHPQVIDCTYSLAAVLRAMGRYQESEILARQALELYRGRADRGGVARTQSLIGACLTGQGRFASAEFLLLATYGDLNANEATGDSGSLATTRRRLVELYEAWGKTAEADRFRPPPNS